MFKGLSDWIYYWVHAEVKREDWPVFQTIIWYCKMKKISLPKGRCHFGEIALLYAPTYIAAGHLYKWGVVLCKIIGACFRWLWFKLIFLTTPIWRPIDWFGDKVQEDSWSHRGRPTTIFLTTLLSSLIGWGVIDYLILGNDSPILIVFGFGTTFGYFVGIYLWIWYVPHVLEKLEPFFAFGARAALALETKPPVKVATHAALAPVKVAPAAVATMWSLFAIAGILVYEGLWKKFCRRITYRFDTSKYDFRPKPEPISAGNE